MTGKQDYNYLKERILRITGVDLNAYKEAQMKRRLDTLINKRGLSGYEEYCNLIKTDKET